MNVEEIVLLLADEYTRMAPTYDERVVPQFAPLAAAVLDRADLQPGELVLDLGCGTGNLALQAASRVAGPTGGVVAIDLADGALNLATTKAARAGLRNVRFEMMDVRNIVYRGRLFDAVLSNLGLPAFGRDRCFAEVRRVLKEGGRFLFNEWGEATTDPVVDLLERHGVRDPPEDLARLREALGFARKQPEWQALRRPDALRGELEAAGFSDVAVETTVHEAAFADVEAYLAFRAAWGFVDRELAAMDEAGRKALIEDVADAVAPYDTGEGLRIPWEVHYYRVRE